MIALLQRTSEASVTIDGRCCARIDTGLLVLLGIRRGDTDGHASRLAGRVRHYRVFADAEGRMNLDVRQAGGAVLVVPQFTLAADTRRGRRPGFSTAAPPEQARSLFEAFCSALAVGGLCVHRGVFGADMQVALINEGPVTFWLESD